MKLALRLLFAVVLFACVYALALFVMPSLVRSVGLYQACSWLSGTSLVPQLTFFVAAIVLACILGKGDLSAYGWKVVKPRQLLGPVVMSAITMLILMSPMLILMATGAGTPDEGTKSKGPGFDGLAQTVVFVWIIASICEEVFYRGLLQGVLDPLKKYGVSALGVRLTVPVVFCAIAFGLGHLCLWGRVPPPMLVIILISTTTMGLIAGHFREKTGSLMPAIAAHMTANIVGTLTPLLVSSLHG